jgi:hypothetical protein
MYQLAALELVGFGFIHNHYALWVSGRMGEINAYSETS